MGAPPRSAACARRRAGSDAARFDHYARVGDSGNRRARECELLDRRRRFKCRPSLPARRRTRPAPRRTGGAPHSPPSAPARNGRPRARPRPRRRPHACVQRPRRRRLSLPGRQRRAGRWRQRVRGRRGGRWRSRGACAAPSRGTAGRPIPPPPPTSLLLPTPQRSRPRPWPRLGRPWRPRRPRRRPRRPRQQRQLLWGDRVGRRRRRQGGGERWRGR